MKPVALLLGLALLAFAASGFYVVGGNEKAVVRRFGRAMTALRGSGLHYDLPWPFSRVDRMNLSEVRTLSIGQALPSSQKLLPEATARTPAFLTGDKNVLLVRIGLQYRLREDQIAAFLFDQEDPTERLRLIVESEVTQAVAQCGVDYLQTFGLAELNLRLTRAVRKAADNSQLGLDVDQVTIERVEAPSRVQADFLAVANARAEAARGIHEARTAAEQQVAAANSRAAELRQQAIQQQLARVSQAHGASVRFAQLVAQIDEDAEHSNRSLFESRRLAMQRLTMDVLQNALGKAAKRIVVDSQAPIDLNLQGRPLPVAP